MSMLTRSRGRATSWCAAAALAMMISVGCGESDTADGVADPGAVAASDAAPASPDERAASAVGPTSAAEAPHDDEGDAADDAAPSTPPPIESLAWPADAPTLGKALYAGTWSVKPPEGFDRAWIDEAGLVETFSMRSAGRRKWSGLSASGPILPVNDLLKDRPGPAAAYVYALVQRFGIPGLAPELAWPDEEAVLHLRHRGRVRAWFDGELIIDAEASDDDSWRHEKVALTLTRGFDVLLLKLGRGEDMGPSFDVQVCLSAPDGSTLERQTWNTMRPSGFLDDRVPAEDG